MQEQRLEYKKEICDNYALRKRQKEESKGVFGVVFYNAFDM